MYWRQDTPGGVAPCSTLLCPSRARPSGEHRGTAGTRGQVGPDRSEEGAPGHLQRRGQRTRGQGGQGVRPAVRGEVPQGRQEDHGQDELLAFYEFRAERWIHLRTTNPIESTFATVRLRTKVTKGAGSRAAALAMAFKLVDRVRSGPLVGRQRTPCRGLGEGRGVLRVRPPRRTPQDPRGIRSGHDDRSGATTPCKGAGYGGEAGDQAELDSPC